MNAVVMGMRNAFRNLTRTVSLVVILGLAIGLCLIMLIAHQAVGQKINQVKSSVGNTITILPAGYSNFSQVNNSLTASQLDKVKSLPHVINLLETLTGRLTTIGSANSLIQFNQSSASNNQTNLVSPVTLNVNGGFGNGSGRNRLFINGGGSLPSNFSLPITIIGTNDPSQLNANTGNTAKLTSGKFLNGSLDSNDAMVSNSMASKNNLKIGSTFSAYGQTLTVVGIFDTGTKAGNNAIIVSLPAEQRLTGQSGDVTNAIATVDSLDNLSSTTAAIKNILGSNADIESAQDQANNATQPLRDVQNVSLYSLVGAVIAGSIIILLSMVMIVRERRREIGILKAIGGSNWRIISQFMSEALTLTVLGAFIGLIIGVIGGNPVTNTLVTNSTNSSGGATNSGLGPGFKRFGPGGFNGGPVLRHSFGLGNVTGNLRNVHAVVGWSLPAYGLGAAILIAVIGSGLAGYLISRIRPSEVMRME
ncbi:MAG: ABC transporter permease [Candidatus Saccharimonadales bacterium]